jgi:cytochrome P450 family 135
MTRGTRLPPGSRMPAAVQSGLFAHDPARFLEGHRRRYGPVFRVRFIGLSGYVYVTDPGLARQAFATDRDVGRAGDARRDFLEPVVGENSLLCMEGEEWLRHRKLLGPAFHRGHTDGYAGEIAAIAAAQVARWPLGEEIELRPRMQAVTLEVILRLVFGVTEEATLQRFRDELPMLLEPAGGAALWLLPPSVWGSDREDLLRRFPNPIGSFLTARDRVDELIYGEIARRRASPRESGRDVLSLMLAARDEDGVAMNDVELRDELITLLEAGHETTATALAWAFERLVRHPEVLATLAGDLDDDDYLDAVVRETLRVRPVVVDAPRRLAGPLDLGGYEIPAGWYVAPAIPTVQHDAGAFDRANEFRPERFLEGSARDGWIPFGGGKRHCVGSHLALLEMRVVIREVLSRLRPEAVEERPERQQLHHVTLTPHRGARVILRERTAEAQPARETTSTRAL